MKSLSILSCSLLAFLTMAPATTAMGNDPAPLDTYVKAPDNTFEWEVVRELPLGISKVTLVKLQSQTWQGIPWEHDLVIFLPGKASSTKKLVLINAGGKFDLKNPGKLAIGASIAQRIGAPVAVLLGIPNQPLFDGLREDDLIAETFVRYIKGGDESWPLLFPMVKSLVRAMDAIEEFSGKEWDEAVEEFVVAGASKRGWTTWLTAATDSRVTAIAPMVIDVLNIPEQLPHQIEAFGEPSEQIYPYTKRGLVPLPETDRAQQLWKMVDPYSYRSRLTIPKLIVLGNNDRYWSTDALNLYWDELPEPKHISYSPNAGHNLMEVEKVGEKGNPMRAIDNISAFIRLHLEEKVAPTLSWTHGETEDGKLLLEVESTTPPDAANMWFAEADSRDFRDSRWESRPVEMEEDGSIRLVHSAPEEKFYAYYVSLEFPVGDLTLRPCTQIRIVEPK